MEMTIDEFYENFMQELRSEANSSVLKSTFTEHICCKVTEQGDMPDADLVEFEMLGRGIAVDAYAMDEERDRLILVISDFHEEDEMENIGKTDIEKFFKRLDKFVESCKDERFVRSLEDSNPVVPLADYICKNASNGLTYEFVLISNAKVSIRIKGLDLNGGTNPRHLKVWDLQRLYDLEMSSQEREPMEIDFTSSMPNGIECLRASTGDSSIQSYLLVLPGGILADLYDKYGERLLEQNVRTFLQFRGKVNKGIRNTIKQQPDMFFSYNNGLSATAESVITSEDGSHILKITNLQIVNGGQTTVSIYTARHKESANLDGIFVQVKLSIVKPEKVNDIVPKISEYANTQNKVNAADFFSNHPFHLRIEEISRKLFTPNVGGFKATHWFYERARGQYANAQNNLTKAEARDFIIRNPKEQMFTKTDLAKYYLTFDNQPALVCHGAQTAFAGNSGQNGFASIIAAKWEKTCDENGNNAFFNEYWFKKNIGKAILFRSLNKSLVPILKSQNYGSYKAAVAVYTLAKFANIIANDKKCFKFDEIWQQQDVPTDVMRFLLEIAEKITNFFMRQQTNVSQFAKSGACWKSVQEIPISLSLELGKYLRTEKEQEALDKAGSKGQRDINTINGLTEIYNKGLMYWSKMQEWDDKEGNMSDTERGILNTLCLSFQGRCRTLTDKQAKVLITAHKRAMEDGFYVPEEDNLEC